MTDKKPKSGIPLPTSDGSKTVYDIRTKSRGPWKPIATNPDGSFAVVQLVHNAVDYFLVPEDERAVDALTRYMRTCNTTQPFPIGVIEELMQAAYRAGQRSGARAALLGIANFPKMQVCGLPAWGDDYRPFYV